MNVYWIPTILLSLCLSSAANMISSHNCKVQTECSQSHHMSTKPRAPLRGPRKKQGVQHPIRMGRY